MPRCIFLCCFASLDAALEVVELGFPAGSGDGESHGEADGLDGSVMVELTSVKWRIELKDSSELELREFGGGAWSNSTSMRGICCSYRNIRGVFHLPHGTGLLACSSTCSTKF